jgi:hypothetical protein
LDYIGLSGQDRPAKKCIRWKRKNNIAVTPSSASESLFLFNSFNTLSSIIEEDQQAAVACRSIVFFFRGALMHATMN